MLIFLATLRCANLFVKINDPMPFVYELTKPYETFIFELKPIFSLQLLKNGHAVYLSFKNNFILNLRNKIN